MNAAADLAKLAAELRTELRDGILPYWMTRAVDTLRGGFIGGISGADVIDADAPKGAVLNTRILWSFSAAQRVLVDARYRVFAERAAAYIRRYFTDNEHGGIYWMLDASGNPIDTRKHIYAQAFGIYGLAEHYGASRDERSLLQAIELFRLIERHARDDQGMGYREAFSADWVALDDVRLGPGDFDAPRSMNTHLHLLEAYANLYRCWQDPLLGFRLRGLIDLFLERIVDRTTAHAHLFFDDEWRPLENSISYGHDIEASWLLLDAALVLADSRLAKRVVTAAVQMADAVLEESYDPDQGGLYYARSAAGELDTDKEWWPQAEAIVGFVNAYQLTRRMEFLDAAIRTWAFTKEHIVDRTNGEWYRRVSRTGEVRPGHEKVGAWKCPYHNTRACTELITRSSMPVSSIYESP